MRCRKVRSFLSAYCNSELSGRKHVAVREHLSTCSGCRKEEEYYRSMMVACAELTDLRVSEDFNMKVLNQIGRERFAETRTEAFMPKRAPVIRWGQLIPVASTALALALVFVYWTGFGLNDAEPNPTAQSGAPAWMTAQPTDNPNLVSALGRDWSLDDQLRRNDRMARISNSITDGAGFGNLHMVSAFDRGPNLRTLRVPAGFRVIRVEPVITIYQQVRTTSAREDEEVY